MQYGLVLTFDSIPLISICLPWQFDTFVQLPICNRCAIHFNVIMLSRLNRKAKKKIRGRI